MSRIVLLDSGPLGMVTTPKAKPPIYQECKLWFNSLEPKGYTVVLPEIADDVCYWNIEEFRNWANNAISVVRELRRSFPGEANLEWRKRAIQEYQDGGIDPASLVDKLRKQKLRDLPISRCRYIKSK